MHGVQSYISGSDCGTIGIVTSSDTKEPRFESCHKQFYRTYVYLIKDKNNWGRSPGLVVMGGDSSSKGKLRILDGHFFIFICCKNYNVC